jgi:hypothetical protein
LREFLYPRPNTVNINGEGELTAPRIRRRGYPSRRH